MRRGSHVAGVPQFRRTLRRLPDIAREELADALTDSGGRLLGRARAETPVLTGGLRGDLQLRVARKTLQLRLGTIARKTQRRRFYGYILDQGRKAQVVIARRKKTGTRYRLRVRAIPRTRYEFVFGRRADFIANELPRFRRVVNRILARVAAGD